MTVFVRLSSNSWPRRNLMQLFVRDILVTLTMTFNVILRSDYITPCGFVMLGWVVLGYVRVG